MVSLALHAEDFYEALAGPQRMLTGVGRAAGQATFQLLSPRWATTSTLPPSAAT